MQGNSIIRRLQNTASSATRLKRADFETYNGTPQERTKIAEYEAETPLFVRPDKPLRLAFTTAEEFQTSGNGSAETFSLAHDIIESPNTDNIVLYSGTSRVQPDGVDYAADTFTYTDGGSVETLSAFYVFQDAAEIEIERQAPRSQGGVQDVLYDDVTSLLHVRDQNREPVTVGDAADMGSPLEYVVPKNFRLEVYATGEPAGLEVAYDNFDLANGSGGAEAINALLSIPVRKAASDVEGLAMATKRHMIENGG